jgi:hypothetical protein
VIANFFGVVAVKPERANDWQPDMTNQEDGLGDTSSSFLDKIVHQQNPTTPKEDTDNEQKIQLLLLQSLHS